MKSLFFPGVNSSGTGNKLNKLIFNQHIIFVFQPPVK